VLVLCNSPARRRREFEPAEATPMIGFRGASRYYSPRNREGFALECRAFAEAHACLRTGSR